MDSRAQAPDLAFAGALNAFQAGRLRYADLLAQIKLQLDAGAPRDLLLDCLHRHESIDPLPDYAHDALVALLEKRPPAPDTLAGAREAAHPPAEAATIILDDSEDGSSAELPAGDGESTPGIGSVLANRFQLIELIGEGGLSRVFKASDAEAGVPGEQASPGEQAFVAVKVLKRLVGDQAHGFAALQQEVSKLQSLQHPSIVRILDCRRDGATVFIVMEYLAGISLYSRLAARSVAASGPTGVTHDEATAVIAGIAEALKYAHAHHIVHGDLKPGNVIVTDSGAIKVIDFGMAGWFGRAERSPGRGEAAGKRIGSAVTPRYASPQLMARQKPTATDDVYALACLAYELLTGTHPFDSGSGSTATTSPPLRPGLTQTQYAAIVHGLERERRNRTPSVGQFMEEFRERPKPRRTALWAVSAAILVIAVAWLYGHFRRLEPAAPTVRAPPSVPVPVPAPATPPAVASAPPAATAPAAGTQIRDCPTCPRMIVLPAGSFMQGSASGTSLFEQPQHQVTIAQPLAMAINAVTVAEFREFAQSTNRSMQGCDIYDGEWRHRGNASWTEPGFAQTSQHPVTCTSWNDATAYAAWLTTKTAHRYRLPSAAEWEYAARAGTAAGRPADTAACVEANVADRSAALRYPGWNVFDCDDGYVHTAPVGSFIANAFGLHDMLGNVFQWTQDCWHPDYVGAPTDGSARLDGNCSEREMRGGSWFSSPAFVRASYRNHFPADYRTSSVGFRVVRETEP